MDKVEKTLRNAGYEPDKPVSCLTVKQLYLLIRFAVNRAINHEETVTNKTVAEWSEEDEIKINRIVAFLKNLNVADNDIILKDADWLKSLKRVQPKQEWSEEDEKIRKNCIHFLELQKIHHAATFEIDECITWLNNLK